MLMNLGDGLWPTTNTLKRFLSSGGKRPNIA